MRARATSAVVLMVAAVMLVAVCGQAQVRQGASGRLVARGLSATMSGDLEPVDGSGAWGRLVVEDLEGEAVVSVEGEVFDLEPLAAYSLVLDGAEVLEVETDAFGDATFSAAMTSDSGLAGSYGAALVPSVSRAGDVWQAQVLDQDLGSVLEARLRPAATQTGTPGGTIEYRERISLSSVADAVPVGMARVERRSNGAQLFETVLTGLEAGATYGVVVDDLLVARVQADSRGVAAVRLKAPDAGGPDNELPPELQPVDDLRSVQWTDAAGALVASGVFTGAGSRPVNLLGTVQMVGDASFVVAPADGSPEVTVLVSNATRWGGELTGMTDLEAGLQVLVRGDLRDDGSVQAWLVAGGQAVPPELVLLNGVVDSVGDASFVLVPGDPAGEPAGEPVTVQVDDATLWRGDLTGFGDLEAGDLVHVSGTPLDGGGVLARCVAGLEEPPIQPVLVGGAVDTVGADGFGLLPDDGTGPLAVAVDDQTRWRGSLSGLDDLVPGMPVVVQGELVNGSLVAAVVTDRHQPVPPASVRGTVDAVGTDGLTVDDGQGTIVDVAVDDQTIWAGVATALDQLEPGMWVHVEGVAQGGGILAVHVMSRTEPPTPHVTLVGVVDAVGDAGFDLVAGRASGAGPTIEVLVDDQTVWNGSVTGLGDLQPGLLVLVEGVPSGSGSVLAHLVVGEPDPPQLVTVSGVVDSVSPTGFVVTHQSQLVDVVVDDATIWAGALTGLGDVTPGINVHVEGVAQDDGTVLAHVVAQRPDLPRPVSLVGTVDSLLPGGLVVATGAAGLVEVVVDDATQWGGTLTGLADVQVGMRVLVEGLRQDDGTVQAQMIADEPNVPLPVIVAGVVESVGTTGFVLHDHGVVIQVEVDDATIWAGALTGLGDLVQGMRVVVEGERQGVGSVLAHVVIGEPNQPGLVTVAGPVGTVSPQGFTVLDLGIVVRIAVGPDTQWTGAASGLADLAPGMEVVVEGERQPMGAVHALLVHVPPAGA